MGILAGRVAVITGAGRGIGREHALFFAREGASVVVNDLGCDIGGGGADPEVAERVVREITAAGGVAVANAADVCDFAQAGDLVRQAVDTFGGLDIVVNNAGVLGDRYFAQMTEDEWDTVVRVHLKGHFCVLRQAAEYWKDAYFAGDPVNASVINTASASGTFLPNIGQANYGAAKAGVAALTLVTAAELGRFGVRVNALAPVARTRMTRTAPGVAALVAEPADEAVFDAFHPGESAPLAAYLAAADTTVTGQVFAVQGGLIARCGNWRLDEQFVTDGSWTVGLIREKLG